MVYRIFVEKKEGLDNEARGLLAEAKNLLGIEALENIRLFNRYVAENSQNISLTCPSVYVIVDGEGAIACGDYRRAVKKGDYFFAPACINGDLTVASETRLENIECCLPKK